MIYFWIALTVVLIHQLIFFIIGLLDDDKAINFIVFTNIFYVVATIVTYPYFSMRRYNRSIHFYKKQGIGRLAYLFGKRG